MLNYQRVLYHIHQKYRPTKPRIQPENTESENQRPRRNNELSICLLKHLVVWRLEKWLNLLESDGKLPYVREYPNKIWPKKWY